MKRMKKLLAFLLATMLLLTMIPISASAAEPETLYEAEGIKISLDYNDGDSEITFTIKVDGEIKATKVVSQVALAQVPRLSIDAEGYDVTFDTNGVHVDPNLYTITATVGSPKTVTINLVPQSNGRRYEIKDKNTLYGTFWWMKSNATHSSYARDVNVYVNDQYKYTQEVYTAETMDNTSSGQMFGFDPNTELYNITCTLDSEYYLNATPAYRDLDVYLTTKCPCGSNTCICEGGPDCTCSSDGCNCDKCNPPLSDYQFSTGYGIVTYAPPGDQGGYKMQVKVTLNGELVFESDQFRMNGTNNSNNLVFDLREGYKFQSPNAYTIDTYSSGATWLPYTGGLSFAGVLENDRNYDNVLTIHLVSFTNSVGLDIERYPSTQDAVTGYRLSYEYKGHVSTQDVYDFTAAQIPEIPLGSKVTISAICKSPYEVAEWHHDYRLGELEATGSEGTSTNGLTCYGNTITFTATDTRIPRYLIYISKIKEVSLPTDDEILGNDTIEGLLEEGAVEVNCTTEHGDTTYGLIKDTYSKSESLGGNSADGYTCDITITNPQAYVTQFNSSHDEIEHSLPDPLPEDQTITLIRKDGKWTVGQDEAPIVYNVTCKDEDDPGTGGDEDPDAPTEGDINSALTDIIAVKCDQTDKHDTANLTKTFTATKDNATITEPTDGVQEDSEGDYTYTITVSLTDEQRNAFIEEFDSSAEHKFKSYDPETGKLEVTLKYLPASQSESDKGYTWAPFDSSDFLTIYVTCGEDTGDDDEKPDPPTHEELENLLGNEVVTVECINEKTPEHGEKKYGLLEGSYTVTLSEDGNTCTVTIRAGDYIVEYNKYINKPDLPHGLVDYDNGRTATIKLTHNGTAWEPAADEDGKVTFQVKCGSTIVEVPGEGERYPVYVEPEDPTDPDQTGVSDLLETDDHIQYLFGYPDDSFGPDRNMTRAEAAQMFYNLLKDQDVKAEAVFDDVPEGAWYATPVNVMAELGIVNGVGDDKFEPNREITRAEFTTMAMRFAKVPSGGVNIFTDVAPSDWFYSYVVNSIQYGWIEGYGDGTFRPDRLITRAEVTTIVNRMLDRQADMAFVIQNRDKLTKFTDLTTEHWAYYTIVEATNEHNYKKPAIGEDWTSLKK